LTRNRFLYLLVLVVGTGSLGAEIAAVRLMAPFFGASTIVWANTIGIVLVALSIGYWIGGRLGDRFPDVRGLGLTVLAASALLAAVPFVARPFFNISVDALDRIEAGAFVGSLAAVLVLIAIPVILMGTVSPWAIRIAVPDVEHAGRVAGRIYATSTVGSLFGVLISALLLVPFAGTQRTFLIFAAAIALIGAAAAGWRYLAVPLVIAGLVAVPVGTVKATERGEVIYEAESEHQYIRVVERDDGSRVLELNEGQAIHSLYRPDSYLTGGVWDGYLFLPFTSLTEPPERVAILGNAAGTTARAYGHYFPSTQVEGIEIDEKLEDVGLEYFDMGSNPNLTVHNADARPWLRRSGGGYDVIMVDAYRQPYIPFYLTTTEFFELVSDRLAPGGLVMVNAGHPEGSDDLEKVLGRTMAEVFSTVLRDPIRPTNTLLIGTNGHASAERLAEAAPELPGELGALARTASRRVGPRLEGGDVYTDDRAPVEWLIDRSILGYAAEQNE
jgi:spermidine synthase